MFGLIKSPFNSERRLAALILIHEDGRVKKKKKTKSQGRHKIKTSRVTEMLIISSKMKKVMLDGGGRLVTEMSFHIYYTSRTKLLHSFRVKLMSWRLSHNHSYQPLNLVC